MAVARAAPSLGVESDAFAVAALSVAALLVARCCESGVDDDVGCFPSALLTGVAIGLPVSPVHRSRMSGTYKNSVKRSADYQRQDVFCNNGIILTFAPPPCKPGTRS